MCDNSLWELSYKNNMIPKVIHYCWFGGKPLPKSVKKCISSWRKYCPDYKIVQWDESNFDVKSNNFISEAYKAKAWAFVSDYARLKIIYEQGGIYLDTDVEIINNIDCLLNCNSYFAVQQGGMLINTGLGFGAEAGNQIVADMIKRYNYLQFDPNNLVKLSCPNINTEVLREYGYLPSDKVESIIPGVKVYPPKYFDPYASSAESRDLLCEETLSIHHYDASWCGGYQKFKRSVTRIIGEKAIFRIKGIKSKITGR